ncbi:hypothetical protein LSA36186_13260 [Lachnoanaerobaculum sp. JCM 36186]|nr:hypothetical protein LSA36186_13260 [Lachnoanaerobaculum sp. JCM 36186]
MLCWPVREVRALQTTHAIAVRDCQVRSTQTERKRRTAEAVALLSKFDVDKHIDVEIKLDELDLTSAESKATYAQI